MTLKKLANSSKIFITTLFLASGLLIYIGISSSNQIQELREDANLVLHTLAVENEINNLFSQYAIIQSSIFENLIEEKSVDRTTYASQKRAGELIFKSLDSLTKKNIIQQAYLKDIKDLQDAFYNRIDTSVTSINNNTTLNLAKTIKPIVAQMNALDALRKEMLKEEDRLLHLRNERYKSSVFFTPLITILLGMFALVVFLLSFWRINEQRKETKRTNSFLNSILYNSDDVISFFIPVYDEDQTIIDFELKFTNKAVEHVLGQAPEQFENKRMSDILPMNFENGVFDQLTLTAKSKKRHQFEILFEYDGDKTWFYTKAVPIKNGVLTTSTDTTLEHQIKTDQKELTKRLETQNLELLDNRAFLSNIFKSVSEIIVNLESIRDKAGNIIDFKILFINDAVTNLTDTLPNELIGKNISEEYPSLYEKTVFDKLVKCITDEQQINYENYYNIDDKIFYFESTATKLNDGVTVTTREITEEKLKALELVELNQELEIQNSTLNEAETLAKVGSYHVDIETSKFYFSNNFFKMLGYTAKDLKFNIDTYKTLVFTDDFEAYNAHINDIYNKQSPKGFIYRIKTKQNTIKHLKTSGHFEEDVSKNVYIGVVQDVTEDILAEQNLRYKNLDLEQSNAELASFNRVASHDLQEPMRKIQLFISRINDSEKDQLSDKGQLYFSKVSTAANRMQNLIKHLLAYSRLNKTKIDIDKVDIQNIIITVLEDFEDDIKTANIKVTIGELPTIKGIAFQLEQLFTNLISNAIKYRRTDVTPEISIDAIRLSKGKINADFIKKHRTYVRVSVSDNGIGFDSAHAKKIFNLFERLHHRDAYSGTGIGLAICKKIVENHNGHIEAESKEGEGTTFYIYLPA